MPVTFDVVPDAPPVPWAVRRPTSLFEHISKSRAVKECGGKTLYATEEDGTCDVDKGHGLVGGAFLAYNAHQHLVLTPDAVWIGITTSLARYIDKHAERLRHHFVRHEGQQQITVYGGGSLMTANYPDLIEKTSLAIASATVTDVRGWLECSFTTSKPTDVTVSQLVMMGALKSYFSYKMCLECNLTGVTLEGERADWVDIRSRVDRLREFDDPVLADWSAALGPVLDRFVAAFDVSPADLEATKARAAFFNRVVRHVGGGSGPSYLTGWMVVLLGFNDSLKPVFGKPADSDGNAKFGMVESEDVPACLVEVPVLVDDNGTEHQVLFLAGCPLVKWTESKVRPINGWALVLKPQASASATK